jgi:hypothetical protein
MYGWQEQGIDVVADALERSLSIRLEARHSLYFGDYYRWDGDPGGELILQENFFDEYDQELTVPEYPQHQVILHASAVPDGWLDRILTVAGADLLRRES